MENETIISDCIEKIRNMPKGTKFIISELYTDWLKLSIKEQFDLFYKIIERLKEQQINIDDNEHKGQFVGLPFNISYIKN